jgi:hypothetical protein
VIATNAGDTVAVAWVSSDGGHVQIRVRHIDDERDVWSGTVDLGERGGRAPAVAVSPDGVVWIAWSEATRDGPITRVAHSTDTGWVAEPLTGMGDSPGLTDEPLIAIAGDSRPTIVVRRRRSPDRATIVARDLGEDDTAVPLTDVPSDVDLVRLSVTPDGTAVVGWRRTGSNPQIMAAVRPPGGTWRPATSVGSGSATDLAVAAESGGRATVVWVARDGGASALMARDFTGTRWAAASRLDHAAGSDGSERAGTSLDVGILPDGIAVIWAAPTSRGAALRTMTKQRLAGWSRPTDVAGPGRSIGAPSLAVRSGADRTVAWEEVDHNLLRIRTASLGDPATCHDLSPPNTEAAEVRMVGGGAAMAVYTDRRRGEIMAVDLR